MFKVVLILISAFFALNMGISGFSISFASSYGSNILKKNEAVILYGLFVLIGAVLIGPRVVDTLANKISLQQISPISGFLILLSASTMMFLSNLLKIPQSTSFVIVASFLGSGLYNGEVNWDTIIKILAVAAIFSILSFILTFLITRKFYPPSSKNLKLYENFHYHRGKFKKFIVLTDLYSAFGIGANNAASVVAPLAGSVGINPFLGLALAAPLFGFGAYVSGKKVINTVSKEIIPIGEISAAIVSFITATFVITASLLGLPTPFVQFTTFSILAISCVKDGVRNTFGKVIFKKIISVWLLVPLATTFISFILHFIFVK